MEEYNVKLKSTEIMTTTYPQRPAPSFELWQYWIKRQRQMMTLMREFDEAINEVYKVLNATKSCDSGVHDWVYDSDMKCSECSRCKSFCPF